MGVAANLPAFPMHVAIDVHVPVARCMNMYPINQMLSRVRLNRESMRIVWAIH